MARIIRLRSVVHQESQIVSAYGAGGLFWIGVPCALLSLLIWLFYRKMGILITQYWGVVNDSSLRANEIAEDAIFGSWMLSALTGFCLIGIFLLLRSFWKHNILGYTRWCLAFPSGKVRHVLVPRNRRPKISSRHVYTWSEPLGGWWNYGEIWDGCNRLPFRIICLTKYPGRTVFQVRSPSDLDCRLPYVCSGDIPSLHRFIQAHTADCWPEVLNEWWRKDQLDLLNFLKIRQDLSEQHHINQALLETREQLQSKLHRLQDVIRGVFSALYGTTRLIQSKEGLAVAHDLVEGLRECDPELHSALASRPIPPNRRTKSQRVAS